MIAPMDVPAEYRGLHKYLKDRYADTVVLTFAQIEDLMGTALPDAAQQPDWWANADAAGVRSRQASSWTEAGRTATLRTMARTVVFERG